MYQDLGSALAKYELKAVFLLLGSEISIWSEVNSVLRKTDCVSDFFLSTGRYPYKLHVCFKIVITQ